MDELFDTICLSLPGVAGFEADFFNDPQTRGPPFTNLRRMFAIPSGSKFLLKHVTVRVEHWGGDEMPRAMLDNIGVTFSVNDRKVVENSLGTMVSSGELGRWAGELTKPVPITDMDEIQASIRIGRAPPWGAPQFAETSHRPTTQVTEVMLPGILGRAAKRLGLSTTIKRTNSNWVTVRRPLEGQVLVRLSLLGDLTMLNEKAR